MVTGSDAPGGDKANRKSPQAALSTAERTEKLALLIAQKLQQGYWIESR
jgi:hypothetical protein